MASGRTIGEESREAALREDTLSAVRRYAEEALVGREFVPGESKVPVGGRVIGTPELEALADASLDGWLTEGRFAARFSAEFAGAVGRAQDPGRLGLAGEPTGGAAALVSPARASTAGGGRGGHPRARLLHDGCPIYQYGLVPVYVDVELDTFNPSLEAIGPRSATAPARSWPPTASGTRSTPRGWPSFAPSTNSS